MCVKQFSVIFWTRDINSFSLAQKLEKKLPNLSHPFKCALEKLHCTKFLRVVQTQRKLVFFFQKQDSFSSCHLTIALVPKKIHRKLFAYLRKNKIWVNLHYIPLYKHPFFEMKNKKTKKKYLNSEKYYKMAISLPNYYQITKKEMSYFINLIQKFFLKNRI